MKRTLACFLAILMVLGSVSLLSFSTFAAETTTPALLTYSEGYTKPAGDGTESNPYQIATADDLLWMSYKIGNDDGKTGATPTGSCRNPFAGMYFLQTADIDLGGKILPAIGYYTGNKVNNLYRYNGTDPHCVFGGTYDGAGFKICNGYVASPALSANRNNNAWGSGLFGVIYGATLKNISLVNISVFEKTSVTGTTPRQMGCTGLLVGVAVGGETATGTCNVIENCHADSTSRQIYTYASNGRTTAGQALLHYRSGGLVGFAVDTTLRNCTNASDISVTGCVGTVGGLVGGMTSGVIENCVNYGTITVEKTSTAKETGNRTYGGLVGLVSTDYITYTDTAAETVGVSVKSSTNCGSIVITDATSSNECYFGGLIGSALKLNVGLYTVENCYNMGGITLTENIAAKAKTGALTGYISAESNGSLKLSNSASVDINGDAVDHYYNAKDGSTVKMISCNTKDAKTLDMLGLCNLYVQPHLNTAGSYRFLATINGADWEKATFTVTLINAEGAKSQPRAIDVKTCYNAIVAGNSTVTDPNGRMFIAFAIKDVAKGWKYEISASVTDSTGVYSTQTFSGVFG